jgi:Arc-like DNA binding domain
MAKRKKTDIVQFKLRIREGLRRKLEAVARAEERSLNSEIALRLENSFAQENNLLLLEALLAPGAGLELIRNVATILRGAGRDWYNPPKSHAVAEAIRKVIAVISGELPPTEASFPNRNERGSADQLAWLAGLLRTFQEPGREEVATPLAEFIEAMDKDQATHRGR